MHKIIYLILFFIPLSVYSQEELDEMNTTPVETVEINVDSLNNVNLSKQIRKRIKQIRITDNVIVSYSPVIGSAITTDCFNVKSAVLNILTTKWKEILYDFSELQKIETLTILNDEEDLLNDKVEELKKEITLLKGEIGIDIDTQLNFTRNSTINTNLKIFETNLYRFDKINQICLSILN